MKSILLATFFTLTFTGFLFSQSSPSFDNYFIDKTMRIDYYHIGDAQEEEITLDQVYQEKSWAGSTKHLIDHFNNGRYYVKIYDVNSNSLIFSKGFDSYFGEYKTSTPATKGISRTFQESVLIPYPKNEILFTIERRNPENLLEPLFEQKIDPASVSVIKEPAESDVKVFTVVKSGDPHVNVDVVFLAEGYSSRDQVKFQKDLQRMVNVFFEQEPYKSNKDKFNVYGLYKASEESGVDEPRRGIYRNSALNATFNSMGSERYLLTEDNRTMRNIAAAVPYDAIVIMVNSTRYGGGGIYNLYCTFTSDNQWHDYLLLHEFGHSFTGLGDEYYSSSVAYNDFFPRGIEPTEPNITALLDPARLKWKALATPGIEIPTPWEKKEYDRMDLAYQKERTRLNDQIANLKLNGAPEKEVRAVEDQAETLSRETADKMDAFLQKSKYFGKVGAFEGAGYSSEGLYRPMLDCIMFSKGKKPYCKVCENAVRNEILYYSE